MPSFSPRKKKVAARRRRNLPAENHRSGASRRPRPTGVAPHGERAATRGRPYKSAKKAAKSPTERSRNKMVIVYQSKTGFTKQYAELLGESEHVEVLGPPADHVPAATSSATPGAGTGPQQRQFLQGQGPVARREFRHSLRFCAPKIQCQAKGVTLVMGVLGGGRHGGREALPNLPIAPAPLASFGSFSTWKRNSPPGRRNTT